jgi:hypothetical protein
MLMLEQRSSQTLLLLLPSGLLYHPSFQLQLLRKPAVVYRVLDSQGTGVVGRRWQMKLQSVLRKPAILHGVLDSQGTGVVSRRWQMKL